MFAPRWIAVVTDAALFAAAVLLLLAASMLIALLSALDTRGPFAREIGLSDAAAATIPSCFCLAPEFDVAIPPHVARPSSAQR